MGMEIKTAGKASAATVTSILDAAKVDRQALAALVKNNDTVRGRHDAAAAPTLEAWADTAAWTGTGTIVSANRMMSAAGVLRAAPSTTRWVLRTTLHTTGASGKYAYVGCGSSSAAADLLGFGQGSASATLGYNKGANVSGTGLVAPRGLPALPAGDWLVTISRDETYVSYTIQSLANAGQVVYGMRIPISSFPGGVVNTLFFSANDTTVGGLNWGPAIIYPELGIPTSANWTVGGVGLFGAGKPLVHQRVDPVTGCGHIVSVPGNIDRKSPTPVVLFCHQGQSGVGASPWSDARMASVTPALDTAGYILVASDNGPGITGGGTQDKWGNQAGLDDYQAAVEYVRGKFVTGPVMLLGPSQGGLFSLNLLRQRKLGGIAAAALICPLATLMKAEQDPTYQAAIWAAYGATSTADFKTKVKGFNPVDEPGESFRGVPLRMYYGTSDTTTPPADHQTPLINKITPYAVELGTVSGAVGHLDTSLYQGSDLVTFFNKYR